LNGEKSWISLADVADNFLVIAWTDLEKKKSGDPSGMTAFIVERTSKGFSSGPMKEKWGILAGNTGFFKMDDVEVPAENLVGREGEGFKIAMFALDQGRYTVAAGATSAHSAPAGTPARIYASCAGRSVEIAQHQLVKETSPRWSSDHQASRLFPAALLVEERAAATPGDGARQNGSRPWPPRRGRCGPWRTAL
jgi:glutaryl-CoA dehydrogenase (non-decarboxylating)